MSTRIAKPGQVDQKKLYLNWANHYLRKSGEEGNLVDLKQISDGIALPLVLKAVVQDVVPELHLSVSTDEERRVNLEKCVQYLEKAGVNCSSFTISDLCDGKDRAILSLFYSLSQYKRTPTSTSSSSSSQGSQPPPSRIARPVSPSLKVSHSITAPNGSVTSPVSPNLATSPKSPMMPTGPRRTAGSSIMTSTTFDHPYKRKPPTKQAAGEGEGGGANSNKEEGNSEEGGVKSDPESETQTPKQSKTSKIGKFNSFSYGHGSSGVGKESRLMKPGASRGTSVAEVAESVTPPTQFKSTGPSGGGSSKLQSLHPHKASSKDTAASSAGTSGDAPGESSSNHVPEGANKSSSLSRLKLPSSGRSTPSSSHRSGIQRPSSRLSKMNSGSASNLSSEDSKSENHLGLQRKGSDGAVKRHLVNPGNLKSPSGQHLIQSGTSSLPRHFPKGAATAASTHSQLSGVETHSTSKEQLSSGERKREEHLSQREGSGGGAKEEEEGKIVSKLKGKGQTSRMEGVGFGLKKPGEVKKSGSLLGIRTPNLPSGPHSSTSGEGGDRELNSSKSLEGGEHHVSAPPNDSPALGKKLMQPRAGTSKQSMESRLKRPASPSARFKLHKVTPSAQPHVSKPMDVHPPGPVEHPPLQPSSHLKAAEPESAPHRKGGVVLEPPAHLKGGVAMELCSSSSSLESCETHAPREGRQEKTKEEEKMMTKEEETVTVDPTPPPAPPTNTSSEVESGESMVAMVKPTQLAMKSESSRVGDMDIVSPPADFKEEAVSKEDGHLRFGRRVSPEGMSHEEINSPKTEGPPPPATKDQAPSSPSKVEGQSKAYDMVNTESAMNKEHSLEGSGREVDPTHQHRQSRLKEVVASSSESALKVQRARSLSPKGTQRVAPKGLTRVRMMTEGGGGVFNLTNAQTRDSVGSSNEGIVRKPLKSVLRQRNSDSKNRNSSSSSSSSECLLGSPGSGRPTKVTISPRSSQLVYDPEETGLHPPNRNHSFNLSPKHLSPGIRGVHSERPISFASLDSSTTSESMSPAGSTHGLSARGGVGVARRSSIRSTMSEKLDYHSEQQFLSSGLLPPANDSTPELIESFENQLTNMKAELSDKDRMLSMYENSMADLSTKMHHLKKSLEEKDIEIRQLTEKQTWFDFEGQSLMMSSSRPPSVADQVVLSDGYLSDSAMEQGKEKKKKKGPWRFSFRSKKKENSSHGDHLSTNNYNMETESIVSTRTAKSVKRSFSKKKAPDLVSISEYSPEGHYRDIDTKSSYTLDARSEYGGGGGLLPLWEDDIKVFEDDSPGARAQVILHIDTNETSSPVNEKVNDSGYYSDLLSRLGNGISGHKWSHDSISSDSSNHGDDDNEQLVLGTISVPPEISWISMDSKIGDIFRHHLNSIDPEGSLGLSEDSIYCYNMGEQRRQVGNALLPPVTPYQAIGNKQPVKILLKGAGQQSCDSLTYKTMMGLDSLQSYMAILQENQWLVVMGTKGTCKSSLVSGLASHLSSCLGAEEGEGMEDLEMGVVGGEIIKFSMDKEGLAVPLKYFKTDLVKRVQLQLQPPIVVLEDIYECKDLEQLLVAAGSLSRRPYIIAALSSGTTKGVPLHQLLFHHRIRVITCNPQTDPVVGILSRSLRKQIYQLKATSQSTDVVAERLVNWIPYLLDYLNSFINKFHSNMVNLGPRVFMDCSLNQNSNELESWFISLWNHFIIPYLMGTIMAGIETYTADPLLEWVDVREWVIQTYPWPSTINGNKLRTLNPDDVGWNHAVRPHQNRYLMYKDDKLHDDTRSIKLHDDNRSILQETRSMIH